MNQRIVVGLGVALLVLVGCSSSSSSSSTADDEAVQVALVMDALCARGALCGELQADYVKGATAGAKVDASWCAGHRTELDSLGAAIRASGATSAAADGCAKSINAFQCTSFCATTTFPPACDAWVSVPSASQTPNHCAP